MGTVVICSKCRAAFKPIPTARNCPVCGWHPSTASDAAAPTPHANHLRRLRTASDRLREDRHLLTIASGTLDRRIAECAAAGIELATIARTAGVTRPTVYAALKRAKKDTT